MVCNNLHYTHHYSLCNRGITDYPWAIPIAVMGLAFVQAIFLLVIYMWRKDPMAHRTGFTIVGILLLLLGWSLPGFLIVLPGLLMEEQ